MVHDSLDAYLASATPPRSFVETRAAQRYDQAPYALGDALVFGTDTKGLPREILEREPERVVGVPMHAGTVRSLDLLDNRRHRRVRGSGATRIPIAGIVLAIALGAMLLVALGPHRIPAWIWPVGGALVLVALHFETPSAALEAIAAQWNVLAFIFGLMLISAVAELSGLFAWVADALVVAARGSRRRLFCYIFGSGALLTTIMANDTTAIVFTPIVYSAVAGRGIDALPFLYACTFVADTASFGLPFSNPANLLVIARP